MMHSHKLIRASEVGNYLYCRRSWFLSAPGIAPGLEQMGKRHAGIEYHRLHGEQVRFAQKLRFACGYILFVVLFLAFGYWLYLHFQ